MAFTAFLQEMELKRRVLMKRKCLSSKLQKIITRHTAKSSASKCKLITSAFGGVIFMYSDDYFPVSSMPTMPMRIMRAKNMRRSDAESPKKAMPMTNVPTAPMPVHTM